MEMSTFSTKDDVPIANEMKILFIFIAIWQFVFKVSNNDITNLLAFLKFFVKILGGAFKNITDLMSLNLKALHKCLQISKGDFITYVVCPERNSIYECRIQELMKIMNQNIVVTSHILNTPKCLEENLVGKHC